jgi:GGDEF domain-containing protein
VLPNFSREQTIAAAERIRAAIDKDNPGGKLKVTVSIGVVVSGSMNASEYIFLCDGDKALLAESLGHIQEASTEIISAITPTG